MKIIDEAWFDVTNFDMVATPEDDMGEYIRSCMVRVKNEGNDPKGWAYCVDGSIRKIDGSVTLLKKFEPFSEFDDCCDNGVVECGKCGTLLLRGDAFLSIKHLYLCDSCEED